MKLKQKLLTLVLCPETSNPESKLNNLHPNEYSRSNGYVWPTRSKISLSLSAKLAMMTAGMPDRCPMFPSSGFSLPFSKRKSLRTSLDTVYQQHSPHTISLQSVFYDFHIRTSNICFPRIFYKGNVFNFPRD